MGTCTTVTITYILHNVYSGFIVYESECVSVFVCVYVLNIMNRGGQQSFTCTDVRVCMFTSVGEVKVWSKENAGCGLLKRCGEPKQQC